MLPPYLAQKINTCIQNVGMGFWMRYSFKMVLLQGEISILAATKLHNCISLGTNYSLGSFIWRDLAAWSDILSNNEKYKILKNRWSKMPSLYMRTVNFVSKQRNITVLFKNNITQILILTHAEARQIWQWYLLVVLGYSHKVVGEGHGEQHEEYQITRRLEISSHWRTSFHLAVELVRPYTLR